MLLRISLIIVLTVIARQTYAQKQQLNDSSYLQWTSVNDGRLCDNGSFASYVVNNKPQNSATTVITATNGSWKQEILDNVHVHFDKCSEYAFYQKSDTLFQSKLGKGIFAVFDHCINFKLFSFQGNEYLIYQKSDTTNSLCIKGLEISTELSFCNVFDYFIDYPRGLVVLHQKVAETSSLVIVDISKGTTRLIYRGRKPENLIFSNMGSQFAFTTVTQDLKTQLWHFRIGEQNAKMLCEDQIPGLLPNHRISTSTTWSFTGDDKALYITQDSIIPSDHNSNNPLIFDYRDAYSSKVFADSKHSFFAGRNLTRLEIRDGSIHRLLNGSERAETAPSEGNDIFIFAKPIDSDTSKRRPVVQSRSIYICNGKTGERWLLDVNADFTIDFSVSPDGRYVLFRSNVDSAIQRFSINDKKLVKLIGTQKKFAKISFHHPWLSDPARFLFWEKRCRYVLLQDKFDLWLIDAKNQNKPRNITNGVGRKDSIIFTPIDFSQNQPGLETGQIDISGFNLRNKNVSFHELSIYSGKIKEICKPNTTIGEPYQGIHSSMYSRARNAAAYLILSQKASTAPNYFFSDKSGNLQALSNEHPERNYRWFSSELINYKDAFGQTYQSILYRPDDLDVNKRYPVVFVFYGSISNKLNSYISPEPVSANLNIPLMMSAGYLIVSTEILSKRNVPFGETGLISVDAAADFMSTLPFVDSLRFGLSGHSFGGFETNYIISHSNRYAAALSEAGASNLIQHVNDVTPFDGQIKESYVRLAYGFSAGLDSVPNQYIGASPILRAKDIETPLLLVHNDKDNSVPISQTFQFYNQLRALRKPTWWLLYPGERHAVTNLNNQLDRQKRVQEFFDYYLKAEKMPDWMSKPIKY